MNITEIAQSQSKHDHDSGERVFDVSFPSPLFVDGTPGAVAGWLAMITPALLMIPLLEFVRRKAEHPRFKAVLRCVAFASAGLLLWVTVPLARDAIHGYLTVLIAVVAFALAITKKVDSL